MKLLAHAKINWALSVGDRREDGYHELDMLMQSVRLYDTLEIHPAKALKLSLSGKRRVPSDGTNLVMKSAALLAQAAGIDQGADIRLTKRIPVGAGLGGGSADAAATLIGLNRLWGLSLPMDELLRLSVKLGADVPFCLTGGLARARGVGESLEPHALPRDLHLVIVQPCEGLSTPTVFKAYDALAQKPKNPDIPAALSALWNGDLTTLTVAAGNALTRAAVPLRPEIAVCAQALTHFGAIFAEMTGSGSAVIGLFDSIEAAGEAHRALSRIWRKCYQTRTIDRGVTIVSDIN